MNIRFWGIAALLALSAKAQTSTHDDPIIVGGGSVYVTFGHHTKALKNSNLWGVQGNGRFLYYQHAHLGASAREIQSLFAATSGVLVSKRQHAVKLAGSDQKKLRIEIFLRGRTSSTSPYVAIPGSQPHLILSAAQVATPSCAHPNPVVPVADDQCGSFTPHPSIPGNSSQYAWSWVISSDHELKFAGITDKAQTKRGAPLWKMQYLHPEYTDVEVDYWTTFNGRQQLFSSRDSRTKKTKVRGCPVIEVCAAERATNGSAHMCERSETRCGAVGIVDQTGGSKVDVKLPQK